eukprot:Hpha_TRINITY_DN16715_c3_g2::TRINITY_DN16715_c3_g2_i3::g.76225::m.76225
MNRSLREYGDPTVRQTLAVEKAVRHKKVIARFALLIRRLDNFLAALTCPIVGMVFRGISVRVAERYRTGTHMVWPALSSTSCDSEVARAFMAGTGTLFIVAHRRGVDISWASVFEAEKEFVVPTNTVLTVMSKMPENLLTLLETTSDVVVVMEDVEGRQLGTREGVDLALLAIVEGAFVYEDFQ